MGTGRRVSMSFSITDGILNTVRFNLSEYLPLNSAAFTHPRVRTVNELSC
jgi:hypothetical protein